MSAPGPLFSVLRGAPGPEELAALAAVLLARSRRRAERPPPAPGRPTGWGPGAPAATWSAGARPTWQHGAFGPPLAHAPRVIA